jgi:negative regulator of sigma E activity
MNENDVQDREVLEYVRNRMAADMPPEFTRDVMNDVHRTTQRRRGFAWPMLTGLATVAAAVAAVVIGLGLLNQQDPVGSEATPSASASPEATQSATPETSASEVASPSPSADPTAGEGEFGPIHSMAPDDAFASAQTCEVTAAIVNAEPTDLTWQISFP